MKPQFHCSTLLVEHATVWVVLSSTSNAGQASENNLLHIKLTAIPIPAPSGLPWQLSFLWLRSWDHLYHIRQIFSPCPVQSPQSHDRLPAVPPELTAFPQSRFQPCTSGQGHPGPGGCVAPLLRGHLVHEHPHPHPLLLFCPSWGILGVTGPDAPGTGLRVRGQRQSWQWQWPGKLGSRFSFYFYLGTQVRPRCNAEAPGAALPSPAGARYHLHYLPLPERQTSWWRTASSEAPRHPARTSAQPTVRCSGSKGAGDRSHVLRARLCRLRLGSLHHSQPSRDAQQPPPMWLNGQMQVVFSQACP